MAAQVVDRIVERDGRMAECRTDDIPLGMGARAEDLATDLELPDGTADQLAFRYGHAARAVLDLCEERAELGRPIVPGHPDLLAEVVIAARREQARSVGDVLLRRTRLGLVAAPELRDRDRVAAVARTLGKELGWRRSRISAEAEAWGEVSRAEGLDPSAALAK
jgi:glycerol-3-phosphate dehydrogenase